MTEIVERKFFGNFIYFCLIQPLSKPRKGYS